ncbi:polymer-forming cytoskeletal protein [Providencia rettgeri]
MNKNDILINNFFLCWAIALIAWLLEYMYIVLILFLLSFLFIVLHFTQKKVIYMFRKKARKELLGEQEMSDKTDAKLRRELQAGVFEEIKNTIISPGTFFEGNITSNENIDIYGKIKGDITASNSIVQVMLNGEVVGDIVCNSLIINGKVEGTCESEDVIIEDNGEFHGLIQYSVLSIKKGGAIIGKASNITQRLLPNLTNGKKE